MDDLIIYLRYLLRNDALLQAICVAAGATPKVPGGSPVAVVDENLRDQASYPRIILTAEEGEQHEVGDNSLAAFFEGKLMLEIVTYQQDGVDNDGLATLNAIKARCQDIIVGDPNNPRVLPGIKGQNLVLQALPGQQITAPKYKIDRLYQTNPTRRLPVTQVDFRRHMTTYAVMYHRIQYSGANPYYFQPLVSPIGPILINASGAVLKPGVRSADILVDTTSGSLNLSLFASTGAWGDYTLWNTGVNSFTLTAAAGDSFGPNLTSITVQAGDSIRLRDFNPHKWSYIMTYIPGVNTGTMPTTNITATSTLSMPTMDSRYVYNNIAANVTTTLPKTTGSNRKLQFDFSNLSTFSVTLALASGDAFDTPLPSIATGVAVTLADTAAGTWTLE